MNLSGLLTLLDQLPAYTQLQKQLAEQSQTRPLQLPSRARAAVLARLFLDHDGPVVLLTGRIDAATTWEQALETWLPEEKTTLRFPEPTPLPFDRGPWSERTRQGRLAVLGQLLAGQHPLIPVASKRPIIISSVRAFLQKTLPKREFVTATRLLRVGQIIELEKILTHWQQIGYQPVSVVESAGQFSRRGGILDIFPAASPLPMRIELFGNEIDTIRQFDPTTQRSIQSNDNMLYNQVVVTPAREAMPSPAKEFATVWQDEPLQAEDNLPSWRDDLENLRAGRAFPNLEFYLPLIYPRPASLLEYLPENGLLVIDDWPELETAVADLFNHADQIANEQTGLPPNYPHPLFDWGHMRSELQWWQPLILGDSLEEELEFNEADITLADAFEPGPRYGGQVRPFLSHLKRARREGERIVVLSRQSARLAEIWRDDNPRLDRETASLLPISAAAQSGLRPRQTLPECPPPGTLTFVQGSLTDGFTLVRRQDNAILLDLLTDAEIFGWNRPAPRRRIKPRPSAPEAHFADIQAGDYVVHLDYGIGHFEGLVSRNIGGNAREYLLLRFANEDMLYVPVHHADRLGRWIGSDDRPPQLHRLDGKRWTQQKQKAQRAADELADELLDLYSARETVSGHAFTPDGEWQAELEAGFPYRETDDQLRVITEVKADMERPQPMDRLICGDVGYGKTEVALRAGFKAVLDSKQVAILVPTTILAQQHYQTFKERLAPFPVSVEMLSRFRTPAQQAQIIKGLRSGMVDIVIGTHRLLSDDVSFKDLGLVIVDEEQRFGVAHKEKLKQWRTEVDVLTMTATPIPRTLHMSLSGVRDISIIDTAPAERLPVQTFVGEMDDTRLRRALLRELDRDGQAFVVHNRVQSIDIVQKRIERLLPEAKVVVGHGQMSERKLERIMQDFEAREIDVLVSTTIIESGLDFPNANTLIVDRADQFGLAQLYQLRGRVGRGTRRAYAYFFHAPWRTLTKDAQARLEVIAEETQLGAGYTIAMRDMEIRGVGDLLGAQQSGHITAVGFDLYTRLLATAVKRRKAKSKGETLPVVLAEETLIDLPLAAYIPTDYVPDSALRLRLYRRMATLASMADIDEMAGELADRFGEIPDPTHNLLYQLRIKDLAQRAGVTAITTEMGQIKIRLANLAGLNRYHLQRFLGQDVRVSKTAIWLGRNLPTREWQVLLVQALEKLRDWRLEISD